MFEKPGSLIQGYLSLMQKSKSLDWVLQGVASFTNSSCHSAASRSVHKSYFRIFGAAGETTLQQRAKLLHAPRRKSVGRSKKFNKTRLVKHVGRVDVGVSRTCNFLFTQSGPSQLGKC